MREKPTRDPIHTGLGRAVAERDVRSPAGMEPTTHASPHLLLRASQQKKQSSSANTPVHDLGRTQPDDSRRRKTIQTTSLESAPKGQSQTARHSVGTSHRHHDIAPRSTCPNQSCFSKHEGTPAPAGMHHHHTLRCKIKWR